MPKKKGKGKGNKSSAPAPAPAPAPAAAASLAGDDDDEDVTQGTSSQDAAQTAKSLDSITDGFASGQETKTDSATMNEALKKAQSSSTAAAAEAKAASVARERELARVKVDPADLEFFMENTMTDKKTADQKLRESGGNLKDAIQAFVMDDGRFNPSTSTRPSTRDVVKVL